VRGRILRRAALIGNSNRYAFGGTGVIMCSVPTVPPVREIRIGGVRCSPSVPRVASA
jgi:hypothetical protein